MTQDERASLAHETLEIRLQLEELYGAMYQAFLQAATTFGLLIKPFAEKQMELGRQLARIEQMLMKELNESE